MFEFFSKCFCFRTFIRSILTWIITELSLVSNRGCLDQARPPNPRLEAGVGPLFELTNQKRAVEICVDDKLKNQRELGYKLSSSSLNELEILFLSIESLVTEYANFAGKLFSFRWQVFMLPFPLQYLPLPLQFITNSDKVITNQAFSYLPVLLFLGAFVWYMIRRCVAQEHTLVREKRNKSPSMHFLLWNCHVSFHIKGY